MRNLPIWITAVMVALVWRTTVVQAAPETFNPNLIIYDEEFLDWQGMSEARIQEFLNTKSGVLQSYRINGKTAAEWIYTSAQTYHISAKVLLTTLQKEQSLIENSSPSQRALDYAMGYGCPDSGSCSPDTKGFDKQIDYAGWQFRRYVDQINDRGYTITGWGPGIAKSTLDGDVITPANKATSSFYTYTPHISGNRSFWNLWHRYNFNLQRKYPGGSLIRAEGSPHVWLIQNGNKRRFTNSAAFLSRYTFNQVVTVPTDHLLLYDTGIQISYANYSLLGSPNGGVYLLADDQKRPIKSRQAFQNAGFRWEEVVTIPWAELSKFSDGEEITTENIYPSGRLLQNNATGAIFFVQDGVRHPIVCREIYRSQFGLRRPIAVTPTQLGAYTYGTPIGFKDGDLVTAGTTAFLISGGKKLPIADPATFNAYRFSWGNLKFVAPACLNVHPVGQLLTIHDPVQNAGQ